MAFYLTRHFGTSSALNEGGECTLGYTDSSLYEGDIHYVDMPSVRVRPFPLSASPSALTPLPPFSLRSCLYPFEGLAHVLAHPV